MRRAASASTPSSASTIPPRRERNVASIRELQAAWLALGIHERQSPDVLLAKRFPPNGDDWQPRPVQGLSVRRG